MNTLRGRVLGLLGGLVLVALAGCASVPMGDANQDAALKTFSTPADMSGIYVYRNEGMGAAVTMDVSVNGQALGKTAAHTYLFTRVPPGEHQVVSEAENKDQLAIKTEPGKLYFVWQEVKMGMLYARNKLHLMDEAAGKKGVLETRLAVAGPAAPVQAQQPQPQPQVTKQAVSEPTTSALASTSTSTSTLPPSKPDVAPAPSTATLTTPLAVPAAFRLGDEFTVPYLTDRGREDYRLWLTWMSPKAFAVAANGQWYAAHGLQPGDEKTLTAPSERALALCAQRAKQPCRLFAVDSEVIWDKTQSGATGR